MADRLSIEAAMTLSALIALLEESKEGSMELDARVHVARDPSRFEITAWSSDIMRGAVWEKLPEGMHRYTSAPPYTTSLDSALSLVPEGWGINISLSPPEHNSEQCASLVRGDPPYFDSEEIEASANTAILALVIAALKARRG
jgi:hypothetical protein